MNAPKKGFIQLSLMGWLTIGSAAVILFLGVSLKIQTARLHAEQEAHKAFVANVVRLGKEQQEKIKAEKKRQEQVNKERVKGYEKRLADINSAYQRLLGASGSGGLPPVPDPAPTTDAAARDKQLLDVLRHSDEQTARLIELQEWVREQGKVK